MATTSALRKARNPKTRFNWRVSDFIRKVTSWWLELRARLTGEKYYCNALAGEADYDITINSDMTVSCNCQDYEGTGHFGDLRKQYSKTLSLARLHKNSVMTSRTEKFRYPPACGVAPSGG